MLFPTEVNIESLSQKATLRWKKNSMSNTERVANKSESKQLYSMILTANPRNFVSMSTQADTSVRAPKQEDLKEISLELSILKKKHDLNRGSNFLHDKNLSNLKKQLDNFNQEETRTLTKLEKLKSEVQRLEESVEETMKKQEDALSATKIYNHIIERMKINKLKLDIKNEDIIKAVKNNKKILSEEIDIVRRQKESKIKTKKALESLETFIDKETQEKIVDLNTIEKDVKRKQEITLKREERYKRQIEIAETAANEDREMRATQMREGVIMHKFWYLYMKKRLEFDMDKLNHIEKAFEKVRKNSSINDASEMVTKFLTTEIAYNELRRIVDDSNTNIVKTTKKIQEIENNLANAEKLKPQNNFKDALQKEIIEKLKTATEDSERLMRIKQIHQKINVWAGKILRKLGVDQGESDLIQSFHLILENIKGTLQPIKDIGASELKCFTNTMTLKNIIDNINQKDMKKFRSDSFDENNDEAGIIRDLAHSSPIIEGKLKKTIT
ncbi:hypothetical protein SteCoe_16999 [Stentor coeruleus]|uniref:Uncharacterized protein n=1 Tax=Stentor coeruleus TaxID=5963 RepID=A0A1R2C012_9CILI|nr:hypothetical protein SteCoe_16999 [Stentor coeruleus]